jgi:chromosome segregation ATPase
MSDSLSPPISVPYSDYESLIQRYQDVLSQRDRLLADLRTSTNYQIENNGLQHQIKQLLDERERLCHLCRQLSLQTRTIPRLRTENTELHSKLELAHRKMKEIEEAFQHALNVCATEIMSLKEESHERRTNINKPLEEIFDSEIISLADDITPRCGELVPLLNRLKAFCESKSGSSLSEVINSNDELV